MLNSVIPVLKALILLLMLLPMSVQTDAVLKNVVQGSSYHAKIGIPNSRMTVPMAFILFLTLLLYTVLTIIALLNCVVNSLHVILGVAVLELHQNSIRTKLHVLPTRALTVSAVMLCLHVILGVAVLELP